MMMILALLSMFASAWARWSVAQTPDFLFSSIMSSGRTASTALRAYVGKFETSGLQDERG